MHCAHDGIPVDAFLYPSVAEHACLYGHKWSMYVAVLSRTSGEKGWVKDDEEVGRGRRGRKREGERGDLGRLRIRYCAH